MTERFIPPHGAYQNLLSYQKAKIVYDATVYFCNRFYSKRDRTFNQMVQAARSGKQNILEVSQASATSKKNRDQAHQCSARKPGRAPRGFSRLPARSGFKGVVPGSSLDKAPSGSESKARCQL